MATVPSLTVEQIRPLFMDGVNAIEGITAGWSEPTWEQQVCGEWSATETARHLLAVSRWYHSWLDRAIDGDASPPFPNDEMDDRNAHALTAIGNLSGAEAIHAFVESATSYLARAAEHWDLPFGFPSGTVTVGLHGGIAATEWHLHGWDLSAPTPRRHAPADARLLFIAAGSCVAATRAGLTGRVMRLLIPLGSRLRPWPTLLSRSGRNPRRGHRVAA